MRNGDNMVGKVEAFIKKEGLISREGLHLVAISGGADSVALLLLLKTLNYRIEAAHCNFHLRGEESDHDEMFVRKLCERESIPLHLIHFDTKEYAIIHQVSIEMAARELRYLYFSQLIEDLGAETVCVAHHRDDAVETLLMNLLRGAGIHGLTGIRARNGHIVRPLLCVSREEIEQYLDSIGQKYVTDSTNLEPDVLRNKIRLQLIPLLRQINPAASDNIARTSFYITEAEKVYNKYFVSSALGDVLSLPISSLKSSPSPLCLLHEWLSPLGFNRSQISEILAAIDAEPGREFFSSTHILITASESLDVAPITAPMKPLIIPESGLYRIDETSSFRVELLETCSEISRDPSICTIDASKVKFPLTLRLPQTGDRFHPYGMTGSKLLSDFLADHKIPLLTRRNQLIVADATGLIIWVAGLRTAHPCRITFSTTSVLRLSVTPPYSTH